MLRSVWWRGTDSWRWRSFRLEDSSWSLDLRALQVILHHTEGWAWYRDYIHLARGQNWLQMFIDWFSNTKVSLRLFSSYLSIHYPKASMCVLRHLNQWLFKVVFNILWISRMPFELLYYFFVSFPFSGLH